MNAADVAHKPERHEGQGSAALLYCTSQCLPGLWLTLEPGSAWFLLWGSSLVLVAWLRCAGVNANGEHASSLLSKYMNQNASHKGSLVTSWLLVPVSSCRVQ